MQIPHTTSCGEAIVQAHPNTLSFVKTLIPSTVRPPVNHHLTAFSRIRPLSSLAVDRGCGGRGVNKLRRSKKGVWEAREGADGSAVVVVVMATGRTSLRSQQGAERSLVAFRRFGKFGIQDSEY
uniref:Uncharacterized protein n=1 Tax=Steinernema glaseri TaxID=37863 RepID=A0A1I7YFF2_9BILA